MAPQGLGLVPEWVSSPPREVPACEAKAMVDKGAAVVDARDSQPYRRCRVKGALNLPPHEWDKLWPLLKSYLSKAKGVVVYGRRTLSRWPAEQVAWRLGREGIKAVVMKGGLKAWRARGYPVRGCREGGR